jgi:hypothetical protein
MVDRKTLLRGGYLVLPALTSMRCEWPIKPNCNRRSTVRLRKCNRNKTRKIGSRHYCPLHDYRVVRNRASLIGTKV